VPVSGPDGAPFRRDPRGLDGRPAQAPIVRPPWRRPHTTHTQHALRRELRDCLRSTGMSADDVDDLVLATCEAVTNALEHAQSPSDPFFDVGLDGDADQVTVTVRDSGRWQDVPSGPHRGRGLAMIRLLADTTVVTGASGTTVTMHHRFDRLETAAQG
jgi:anti-sigma regulatory factor (Ser/Thr protein kinase)